MQKVKESCVWCSELIDTMPDEYDSKLHFPICSKRCEMQEKLFRIRHDDQAMNISNWLEFGKCNWHVPRYKGHS